MRLLDHVSTLQSETSRRIAADDADALTLCSMHASKGLEWPFVYVARLNEGECPCHVDASAEAVAEERRLVYVALSRAKERLVLSHVALEPGSAGQPIAPSRFIAELPHALLSRRLVGYDAPV